VKDIKMLQKLRYQGFDEIDRRILSSLQERARLTNLELAEAARLSPAACLRRVRELQASGVIRRYVALLDPKMLGLGVSVFVRVTLENQGEKALERFEKAILGRPEVLECYLVTGDSDYLLRVVCADLEARTISHESSDQGNRDFLHPFLLRPQAGEIFDGFAVEGNASKWQPQAEHFAENQNSPVKHRLARNPR
jgi:DNA-binding Lrp family transcriptional regulator